MFTKTIQTDYLVFKSIDYGFNCFDTAFRHNLIEFLNIFSLFSVVLPFQIFCINVGLNGLHWMNEGTCLLISDDS